MQQARAAPTSLVVIVVVWQIVDAAVVEEEVGLDRNSKPSLVASIPTPGTPGLGGATTLWQPAHGGHVGFPQGRFPGRVLAMPEAVADWLQQHA